MNVLAKREEAIARWRKFHGAELHYLYFPPDIFRVIKSRNMRWAGLAVHMGQKENVYSILVGKT
jgi:hypothetical protein